MRSLAARKQAILWSLSCNETWSQFTPSCWSKLGAFAFQDVQRCKLQIPSKHRPAFAYAFKLSKHGQNSLSNL